MIKLKKEASRILDAIAAGLEKPGDHRKIDNAPGVFSPLSVECISARPFQVSLCHYGEQNGDLMRDPEMVFYRSGGAWYPTYYRNDYVGFEQWSVKFERDGFKVKFNSELMKDQADFAATWMQNLVEQQGIETGEVKA